MKRSKSPLLLSGSLFLLLMVGTAVALPPRITWTPNPLLTEEIAPGEEAIYEVTLKNTGYLPILAAYQLQVVAEGAIVPYATIAQPKFPSTFKSGQAVKFSLKVSVPDDAPAGTLEGMLLLKRLIRNNIVDVWRTEELSVQIKVDESYAAMGEVGQEGGAIAVTNPSSPIYGTVVNVPTDALDPGENVRITIDYSDSLPAPVSPEVALVSKVFAFEKDLKFNFRNPVSITLPIEFAALGDDDIPVVFYWSTLYNKYRTATVTAFDRDAGTVTFETIHFTFFIVVKPDALPGATDIDLGFSPAKNGFFHGNFNPNYYNTLGSCVGMSTYTQWYYGSKTQTATDLTPLYEKYREGDPDTWQDDATARELISRVHKAANDSSPLAIAWADIFDIIGFSANSLLTGMQESQEPQLLGIRFGIPIIDERLLGHLVVVYGWDAAKQQFKVYDPNFPGEEVTLGWSGGRFNNYSKKDAYPDIDDFFFVGTGSILEGSELETFYQGAEQGWSLSVFNDIQLTDPVPDANGVAIVTSPQQVVLRGSVSGGNVKATSVVVYVNGARFGVAEVDSISGDFTFSFSDLPKASNTLQLLATNNPRDTWNQLNAYAGFREFTLTVAGKSFFQNSGFEAGDFAGWEHETHTWSNLTPGSVVPEKNAIVSTGFDPIDTELPMVYQGQYAVRINSSDGSYHISTLTQSLVVPTNENPIARFYWAAVLEDPDHSAEAQPFISVRVFDEETGDEFYSRRFYSNDPAYSGWRTVQAGSTWRVIPWQQIFIDLTSAVGRTVRVEVTAADCGYGAHGGYVYFDGDDQ